MTENIWYFSAMKKKDTKSEKVVRRTFELIETEQRKSGEEGSTDIVLCWDLTLKKVRILEKSSLSPTGQEDGGQKPVLRPRAGKTQVPLSDCEKATVIGHRKSMCRGWRRLRF